MAAKGKCEEWQGKSGSVVVTERSIIERSATYLMHSGSRSRHADWSHERSACDAENGRRISQKSGKNTQNKSQRNKWATRRAQRGVNAACLKEEAG